MLRTLHWALMVACVSLVGCADLLSLDEYADGPAPVDEPQWVDEPTECEPMTADCDGDGVCDDLSSSLDDCGMCGAVCDGSACVEGSCQLAKLEDASVAVLRAYEGAVFATDIKKHVVWRASLDGPPQPVVATQLGSILLPIGLQVDRDGVFWVAQQAVLLNAPSGPTVEVPTLFRLDHDAVGAAPEVLWSEPNSSGMGRVALGLANNGQVAVTAVFDDISQATTLYVILQGSGETYQTISPQPGTAVGLALSSTDHVFWAMIESDTEPTGRIMYWNPSVGSMTLAVGRPRPNDVALVDGDLYWTEMGVDPDLADGAIMRLHGPFDGRSAGEPEVVVDNLYRPLSFQADSTHLYWIGQDPTPPHRYQVTRVALAGGEPELLAVAAAGLTLPALSLTNDAVVWGAQAEAGADIYRRSKAAYAISR